MPSPAASELCAVHLGARAIHKESLRRCPPAHDSVSKTARRLYHGHSWTPERIGGKEHTGALGTHHLLDDDAHAARPAVGIQRRSVGDHTLRVHRCPALPHGTQDALHPRLNMQDAVVLPGVAQGLEILRRRRAPNSNWPLHVPESLLDRSCKSGRDGHRQHAPSPVSDGTAQPLRVWKAPRGQAGREFTNLLSCHHCVVGCCRDAESRRHRHDTPNVAKARCLCSKDVDVL